LVIKTPAAQPFIQPNDGHHNNGISQVTAVSAFELRGTQEHTPKHKTLSKADKNGQIK
jgi:hypothetical protein